VVAENRSNPKKKVRKTPGTLWYFMQSEWVLIVTLGKYNCLRLA